MRMKDDERTEETRGVSSLFRDASRERRRGVVASWRRVRAWQQPHFSGRRGRQQQPARDVAGKTPHSSNDTLVKATEP